MLEIKELEKEKTACDNKLAKLMADKEKFVVPGGSITYKIRVGTERANAKAVRAYFETRGEKIPKGLLSKDEDSRGIRFYASRKKS